MTLWSPLRPLILSFLACCCCSYLRLCQDGLWALAVARAKLPFKKFYLDLSVNKLGPRPRDLSF